MWTDFNIFLACAFRDEPLKNMNCSYCTVLRCLRSVAAPSCELFPFTCIPYQAE